MEHSTNEMKKASSKDGMCEVLPHNFACSIPGAVEERKSWWQYEQRQQNVCSYDS